MRRIIIGVAAALTLAGTLEAQAPAPADTRRANTPPVRPAPAPAARPRVGYAATPAPEAAPAPVVAPPPVYYYPDGYGGYSGYIVTGAPYVVLQDGSVAANFGNGYERVLRPCASSPGSVSQSQQSTGRDALGRILPPPGIAALQAGTRGQLGGSMPARNVAACYRTDASGRVEVVQAR